MAKELEPYQNIERSIIKKFRKEIWRPFIEAVQRYELVNEGDKIAVCISGGKDSMLMAKLMQELQRHSKVKFELVFLVMDPGYNVTRCSRRMRRSSKAEAGSSCTLCPDGTIFSLALQSRWDEWYLTTPSEELGVSFLPLSPMME